MDERIFSTGWTNYELIDAGGGKKLERFGNVITIRPELQAYFKSSIPFTEWEKQVHFTFSEEKSTKGKWKKNKLSDLDIPEKWNIEIEHLTCQLELTNFKHIGIFPEQVLNWSFISENLKPADRFLNLFAYSGIASIVARNTGASVTHVDSIKQLVNWAKTNMELNQLSDIRWIIDDALLFTKKEVKRGNTYDFIIMDPPAFGFGSKGERWILEEQLPLLIENTFKLLNEGGTLIINTYSPKLSLNMLKKEVNRFFSPKKTSANELWMKTKHGKELFFGNLIRCVK